MTALVIDDKIRAEIKRIVAIAEATPISLATMRDRAQRYANNDPTVELETDRIARHQHVMIPMGYRATFTIEEQPFGLARHLSVSSPEKGNAPVEIAIEMIMSEFGFKGSLTDCRHVYTEEFEPGWYAVNVIQKYSQ